MPHDSLLRVVRKELTDVSTCGEFYLPDGSFFCYTLEDPCRPHKISDQTAIPSGNYEVICSWSNRFQRIMPRLMKVPFYDGILIHSGNTPSHTSGCILIGKKKTENAIYESHAAFDALFPILKKITEKGKLFVSVEGGYPKEAWT